MRAIEKLAKNGSHPNVIAIFDHGWLHTDQYYYFDMQLCVMNLEDFMKADFNAIFGSQYLNPGSTEGELPQCLNLWTIIRHITSGLEHIHQHHELHRDLKPRNGTHPFQENTQAIVLLSIPDNAWKITDFGLTSEGTSKYPYTTQFARGTEGYRAPELIREHSFVSQASDIWGLGCILYELVFKIKAFTCDYHVFEYIHNERKLEISDIPISERLKTYSSELILRMLDVDWRKRPSAPDVRRVIDSVLNSRTQSTVLQVAEARLIEFQNPNPEELQQARENFVPEGSLLSNRALRALQTLHLDDNDRRWTTTIWTPCWYGPPHIF